MSKRVAWNKGKKTPEDVRRKLSESHKGYVMPEEQKRKIGDRIRGKKHSPESIRLMKAAQSNRNEEWRKRISEAKKGAKNPLFGKKGPLAPQWRGGITPVNLAIRNSLEMKAWRLAVFERDKFTCRACGIKGVDLHAHHVLSFSKFPEHRFDVNNGLTLCPACHQRTDNYAGKTTNKRIHL